MHVHRLCSLCVVWVAASETGWSLVQRSLFRHMSSVWFRDLKRGSLSLIWRVAPQKKYVTTYCHCWFKFAFRKCYNECPWEAVRTGIECCKWGTLFSQENTCLCKASCTLSVYVNDVGLWFVDWAFRTYEPQTLKLLRTHWILWVRVKRYWLRKNWMIWRRNWQSTRK